MNFEGRVLVPLDEAGVKAHLPALDAEEVESVAIGFLHAYANPDHEKRTAEIIAAARPGHTEKQVANDIVRHMFEGGCEETAFLTIATGRNASRAHHMPDATPLRPGEIVRTDLGGCFRGYYSDVGRTHVVGAPSPAQAETYRRLHGVYRGVLELMTVGRPISELYDACRDRSHGAGLPFFMHHIGHGLGVEIHEPPMVEPQERTLLQESMLFNIELYHRDGEGEGYFVEDLVQITAGGPRILTGSLAPAEIPVIA